MRKKSYNILAVLFLITVIFCSNTYPQQIPVVQNIINQLNQDSIFYFVKELAGNVPTVIGGQPYTIVSRHKNQPGNDKATEYIKQKLESYGLTTTVQTFSTTGKNVYAVLPGTKYPNKKYMICAHMDDMPSGVTAPGADDNASGTAAVIEAARIFKNYSFPYTIIFALWDEEEQGLVGSAYYANLLTSADSLMGVVNMDMIAYDSNNDNACDLHTKNTGSSMMLTEKMIACNTIYNLGLVIQTKNPGSTASDHASFWNKGIGAILLIEDMEDFHQYYHTVNDNITYYNNPYFYKMAKLSFATLATLALDLNVSIAHTPVVSSNYSGPIPVIATVNSGLAIGTGTTAPRLYYRTGTGGTFGSFSSITGSAVGNTYTFNIPTQAMGTIVQYYLAAQDSAGNISVTLPSGGSGFNPPGSTPPTNLYQFYVAQTSVVFYDTTNTIGNWTVVSPWGLATNKYVSAPNSFTDSPSGNYLPNANCSITMTNPINLSNVLGASLEFETQWDIEVDYDYGQVLISTNNGTSWVPLAGTYMNLGTGSFQPNGQPLYDGVQSSWVTEKIDLSAYKNQQIKLRFLFVADNAIHKDGWYIDNIRITAYSAVPVELQSFAANVIDNNVNLTWFTATETNNNGFKVERSKDNKVWEEAGFIKGNGTSSSINYYSFVDSKPLNGKSYYRLNQIDFDGSNRIYDAVEVDMSKNITYVLSQNYPNPFNPSTIISFRVAKPGLVTLKVYDILGKEVAVLMNEEKESGYYNVEFNAAGLASGTYIYKLQSGEFTSVKKMNFIK